MRERNHFVGLWLDEKEYGHLNEQCSVTGLSISAFVRKLINGTRLRPRPPDQYSALLRELSAIGNNINQIAYWATHALRCLLQHHRLCHQRRPDHGGQQPV